jgi:hypothetical protein
MRIMSASKPPHRKKALCSPLSTHPSHGPAKRISLRNPPTKNFCKKNKTGNPPGNAKPQLRILTQKINSRICGNGTTSRNFFVLKNVRWAKNKKHQVGLSAGFLVLSIIRFSVLSQWLTFQFFYVVACLLHLTVTKNNMRRCLFLWGSTVKCSITDKSPFLAQSFKFAHLPTKKGNDRYVVCYKHFLII